MQVADAVDSFLSLLHAKTAIPQKDSTTNSFLDVVS